ncbi:unnamed protein product [Brassicogethes aeneus]|uniref:Uncharacterized protein n=1 Tax=Brassicogethes aeneus TaxID=1431903 RepID=A0A9P0FAW0_BRAAE|nr:unnamed protein product [Brassicogethes aeneus]
MMSWKVEVAICLAVLYIGCVLAAPKPIHNSQELTHKFSEFLKQDKEFNALIAKGAVVEDEHLRLKRQSDISVEGVDVGMEDEGEKPGFFDKAAKFITENCNRPNDLITKEELCWKSEVELVERIQQTSKSVLNFAKKKLGMETEETNEEQKCTYYQCILAKLKLINNGFPIYENFEKWIESEVIYEQAKQLLNQLNICNEELSRATGLEINFNGDFQSMNTTNEEGVQRTFQTECDLAAEFLKCLSHQEGCPVFVYP